MCCLLCTFVLTVVKPSRLCLSECVCKRLSTSILYRSLLLVPSTLPRACVLSKCDLFAWPMGYTAKRLCIIHVCRRLVGIPVPSHGTLPSSLSRRMEPSSAGDQSSLMHQHTKCHNVLLVCSHFAISALLLMQRLDDGSSRCSNFLWQ